MEVLNLLENTTVKNPVFNATVIKVTIRKES